MPGHKKRQAWVEAGLCKDCGEPRGAKGTSVRCESHAALHSRAQARRNAQRRAANRRRRLCEECGEPVRVKRLRRGQRVLCREHKFLIDEARARNLGRDRPPKTTA